MIQQLEQGRAVAVLVKDLSRLGRNYIEVGRLTEEFFPEHDIRLVAVSDNIDTAEGENELAPIREEVVLGEIRRLTKFASLYEDEFPKAVIGHSQQAEETDRKLKEKELRALLARDEELDGLFERIYEDNVSGKLADDRFAKMSRRY